MIPPNLNSLAGAAALNSGTLPIAPASVAERLVGFLDSGLGSREQSAALWGGLKTLAANPLLCQIAASPTFAEITAAKRDYVSFEHLSQVVQARQGDFGLGFFQMINLGATLLPWQGAQPILEAFAAEYAQATGYPEGMAALEIGLYLALHPQSEELTRAVFAEVDRHLTS